MQGKRVILTARLLRWQVAGAWSFVGAVCHVLRLTLLQAFPPDQNRAMARTFERMSPELSTDVLSPREPGPRPLSVSCSCWYSRCGRSRPAAALAPVIALLLHSLTIYQLTGRPFAWSEVQVAWGRTCQLTTWLGEDLAHVSEHGLLSYVEAAPVTALNGLAAIGAIALLWPVARRAGVAYGLFIVVSLAPAIA
jgi:hypothetical protein